MKGIKDKFPHLPDRISGLRDLAYNLWWSWHPEGRGLFKLLSRRGWFLSGHNPVRMLNELDESILDSASRDLHFLRHYDSVMERFESYMDPSSGWFCASIADPRRYRIAYFSAEYGLHHALPFYAGGLGFLAGDFLKECSDLGIPLIGMGFMYPQGYIRQMITPDGWQAGACEILDRENAPISRVFDLKGDTLSIKIHVIDPPVYLEVWRVQVGKTDLYLIDSSSEANEPENRSISDRLYTGDPEKRLRQEIVLGIGGVHILKALGIEYTVIHLNEGHPAFAILERIREKVEKGKSFRDALKEVQATTVFTTHTPVPAGHDIFPPDLVEKYFSPYLRSLEIDWEEFLQLGLNPADPGRFNMTAFAIRCSGYRNAVSKRHQEVTRNMWNSIWPNLNESQVPIDYITNGIHVPSWIDRRLGDVIFNRYLGRMWLEEHDHERIWEMIDEIPDNELWKHHMAMKNLLITRIRERARQKWMDPNRSDPRLVMASGVLLDPPILTLGFARRFALYKRPTLLLQDIERLKQIVNDVWRPVQIVFAGKAHQDDQKSKMLLQQVFRAAQDFTFGGRIAFVEDYDELLAQYLVHGVDVWVNNPLPPMEACGTSGMKSTLNGVPQLSILDGWWIEGYNEKNGWAFEGAQGDDRDAIDAGMIYDILEEKVLPLYYDVDNEGIPHGWVQMMKEAIKVSGRKFSARRMAKEYTKKFYFNAIDSEMKADYRSGRGTGIEFFSRI